MGPMFRIAEASDVYRQLLDEETANAADRQPHPALRAFSRFARADFPVPENEDADGCLFEYGVTSLTGSRMFTLNLTRQLELPEDAEEGEGYLQVSCELHYTPVPALEALGSDAHWWFRGTGEEFADWYASLPLPDLLAALGNETPAQVTVAQDLA
ncbi:hypothetical protein [Streptomyces sp. HNM0574]|uniref:hypothetical protein n=1 Tax=Streptomyces sp. HNM0574 TaxID=2714954 RepID=UPI00146E77DA|nr:hypothetical protein [Streptomyces sp. HNM0574]NLU70469.1 hypothetical protein [Streptomyces sp. HNM0574]